MLQFEDKEVRRRIRCFVQVLQSNLSDEIDILARFSPRQCLRRTNAVLQFEGSNSCIVFNGVTHRWLKKHSIRQAVDPIRGGQTSVHANGRRVIPSRVHAEVPRDFLPVVDVGNR